MTTTPRQPDRCPVCTQLLAENETLVCLQAYAVRCAPHGAWRGYEFEPDKEAPNGLAGEVMHLDCVTLHLRAEEVSLDHRMKHGR